MSDVNENAYTGHWPILNALVDAAKIRQAQLIEAEKECDHQGKWRIAPGPYKIVRFCGGCGKSWWVPARDETVLVGFSSDDKIIQEWELIREPVVVQQVVVGDYDHAVIFADEDDDQGDDEEEFP